MNMPNCRFENTFNDFCDCLAALKDEGMPAIKSRRERSYAEDLMKLAVRYVEVYKQSLAAEAQEKQ